MKRARSSAADNSDGILFHHRSLVYPILDFGLLFGLSIMWAAAGVVSVVEGSYPALVVCVVCGLSLVFVAWYRSWPLFLHACYEIILFANGALCIRSRRNNKVLDAFAITSITRLDTNNARASRALVVAFPQGEATWINDTPKNRQLVRLLASVNSEAHIGPDVLPRP